MSSLLYAGSKGAINFNINKSTIQFVAHLVIKRTDKIVGKFSYPSRDNYQLLEKDGDNYKGKLTVEMTKDISNEVLEIHIKPFVDADTAPIAVAPIRRVGSSTLAEIDEV